MAEPPRLFTLDDEPCSACNGKGRTGPVYDERPCPSCGGTGRAKDQYDPATSDIPY